MTHTAIPQVIDDRLHLEEVAMDASPIPVDSPFWFDWLTDIENRSFSFKGQAGTFTARHERQRNSWYWYAHQKHQGKVRKAYLSKAEELTAERLHSIAETLAHKRVTSITHDTTTSSATHADDWITISCATIHAEFGNTGSEQSWLHNARLCPQSLFTPLPYFTDAARVSAYPLATLADALTQ